MTAADSRRRHSVGQGDDQRTVFARDRDRVLYSQAFQRLAGVTQVVSPSEGLIFHSRLTHSMKVAQLARRLAEHLLVTQPDVVEAAGGIEPEAADAAGLAHDIGHPPFGHAAEQELQRLVAIGLGRDESDKGGYEGNAQAFRVLTTLAPHRARYLGLNLTRRTLRAVLKYPWLHDPSSAERARKYGAYGTEAATLEWVLEGSKAGEKSLEAQIMDLADDLTYSVHDLQDFFRAGLINPASVLAHIEEFLASWFKYLDDDAVLTPTEHKKRVARAARATPTEHFEGLLFLGLGERPYTGSFGARTALDEASSMTIGRLLRTAHLKDEGGDRYRLDVPDPTLVHLRFLQRIVWTEVIQGHKVASQQVGQKKIVRTLYETYHEWIDKEQLQHLPRLFAELVELSFSSSETVSREVLVTRFAADIVASLTDREAVLLYHRLTGSSLGAVTDLMPSAFS